MEHIIQFGIGIDDDRIIKEVEKNAEKTIIEDLKQKISDQLFRREWPSKHGDPRYGFSDWAEGQIDSFLTANKDAIIDMAGKYLAEKLARTKAARELLKEDKHENV